MNTEEMFLTMLNRMDSIEAGLTSLNGRMDKVDSRMDKLEVCLNAAMDKLDSRILRLKADAIMELFLVRREIHIGINR